MALEIGNDELTSRWTQRWGDCRPIAHEFRDCMADRWVRFHSLPESKRYAETDAERDVVLHRHNTVIDELVSTTNDAETSLLILTSAWSIDSEPSQRSEQAIATTPLAKHWQKVLTDEHEGEETWTHLYVDSATWKTGVLDNLLRVVADDEIRDAFMAPTNFEWLYHPYDGGADVIAPTPKMRDLIRDGHRAWLSKHPEGL